LHSVLSVSLVLSSSVHCTGYMFCLPNFFDSFQGKTFLFYRILIHLTYDEGFYFHQFFSEASYVSYRNSKCTSNKSLFELKLSSASENLFLSFLCIFPLITIALSISFTIKNENYLQGKSDSKRNKATLISLCSRERATSADIGREFRPLRLVWWALSASNG